MTRMTPAGQTNLLLGVTAIVLGIVNQQGVAVFIGLFALAIGIAELIYCRSSRRREKGGDEFRGGL